MLIYVVQNGDTLWDIARRFGVGTNVLITVNEIENPNVLVVGQALVIPAPNRYHVVQPGEVLWRIAQRYGTTIDAIVEKNNIADPSQIYPGLVLTIPARFHTVQSGQTLWTIAQRYDTSVQAIAAMNGIANPNRIIPGQILEIPEAKDPVIETNAYITTTGEDAQNLVRQVAPHLTYLSPFSYGIKADGSLLPLNDQTLLQTAITEQIAPLLVLTNFNDGSFSSDLAQTILNNQDIQETLITNILNAMAEKGYRGLNIDFEYVYQDDREQYNQFLRHVVSRLHEHGYLVSTALAPKESADQEGLLYEAHDYAAHGEIVDFVVLMTYEWGWAGGRPWAIAPVNKVRQVLDYAVTVIPPEKILMGMPNYGRDWQLPYVSGETVAKTISPQEALSLAARYNASIQYHAEYQAPYFRYTDDQNNVHEVWFEDARSAQAKFDLVKDYHLRGISYWVLGHSFPQNWLLLEDNFDIKHI
ncbi:LysM peptidoglycan-binding domain-containing protein [Tuberibacillus sp. Marseille-P3662]|uniref:LysM peptidoglycan-binding domain-containing protein n=1 Tax=Tuberibacillus sp. Marseille-P3662 TaxID=1965358 RepID=UPI000A1CA25B|nr:LysM peptidoglycan-binding domain-containing protein [Tuberibacillus sp. Marseille-P3662]